jgi:hypothetical protein
MENIIRAALIILLPLNGLSAGTGVAFAQAYSSYISGTQIHSAASNWGNSPTHHLLDTVTLSAPLSVSTASWDAANVYTSQKSMINIYDAGLHCLLSPGVLVGGCMPGMLYAHTGPLLSSQTNPKANTQVSVPLVADQNCLSAHTVSLPDRRKYPRTPCR